MLFLDLTRPPDRLDAHWADSVVKASKIRENMQAIWALATI